MAIQALGFLKGIPKFLWKFTSGAANGYSAEPVILFGSDGNPAGGGTPIGSVEAQGIQPAGELYAQNPLGVGAVDTDTGFIESLTVTGGALNVNTTVSLGDTVVYGPDAIGSAPTQSPVFFSGWDGTNIRAAYLKLQSANVLTTEYGLVTSAVMRAQHDDVAPTVPTENQFSSLRITSDRSLIVAPRAITGTLTSVAANDAASQVLMASNIARKGGVIFNSTDKTLYYGYFASADTTNYSGKLLPQSTLEIPFGYTGVISGIWDADPVGSAKSTEFI